MCKSKICVLFCLPFYLRRSGRDVIKPYLKLMSSLYVCTLIRRQHLVAKTITTTTRRRKRWHVNKFLFFSQIKYNKNHLFNMNVTKCHTWWKWRMLEPTLNASSFDIMKHYLILLWLLILLLKVSQCSWWRRRKRQIEDICVCT